MGEVILGKVIIEGRIKLETGLHIGAQRETMEVGGLDNPVLKDPITGKPYIPGSSLKGKMRSLLERSKGFELNRNVGTDRNKILIHACDKPYDEIKKCEICRLFGTSGRNGDNFPARLIVRDAFPIDDDVEVEVKYETAIDRITSSANPRPMEMVPPGTEFAFEIVYTVEDEGDKLVDLRNVFSAMKLLEDDYLGGCGSRGYGKVKFKVERIVERSVNYYFGKEDEKVLLEGERSVEDILSGFDSIFHESG